MDSEKTSSENNPEQNQLDLGFNQVEPITPKKHSKKAETSFLNKAKSIFAKKEKPQPRQFNVRKEPTIGIFDGENKEPVEQVTQVENEPISNQNNEINVEHKPQEKQHSTTENVAENTATENASTVEISESAEKRKFDLKHPENWAILQLLPQKHRRLFIALFLVILLLLFFFWLKPNEETVESFVQQNSNSLPIEFQPINQEQTTEPMIESSQVNNVDNTANNNVQTQDTTVNVAPVEPSNLQATTTNESSNANNANTATATNVATTNAVTPANVDTGQTKAAERAKLEKERLAKERLEKQRLEKEKAAKAKAEEQQRILKQFKEQKPITLSSKNTETATVKGKSVKTLTISSGKTLMQVFRDNQLNIADVNAMTKAKGGNVLGSLKSGEKVQVSLNAGRVTELRLSNGSRFIRQADGSYLYKK